MYNQPVLSARITTLDNRTGGVRIVTLTPLSPFAYEAGQYVRLHIAGFEPRPYSIANAPRRDGTLSFHIRNTQTGISAHMAENLEVGDDVMIEGPYGTLSAAPAKGRPVTMVGGGTGIAPLLALAEYILIKGLTDDGIYFYYGVRDSTDVYCTQELETLQSTGDLKLIVCAADNTPDKQITHDDTDLRGHCIYVCGPNAMVEACLQVLQTQGAPLTHIYGDSPLLTARDKS